MTCKCECHIDDYEVQVKDYEGTYHFIFNTSSLDDAENLLHKEMMRVYEECICEGPYDKYAQANLLKNGRIIREMQIRGSYE